MNKEQKTMDPSRYPSYTEEDSAASGRRLNEILKVLKKHQLTSGLTPVKLREILEDLGPTYVKLGQIMSMRSDMLPEVYCQELTRLRTDVIPCHMRLQSQSLNPNYSDLSLTFFLPSNRLRLALLPLHRYIPHS